jgi:hypothetical protein
VTFTGGMGAQIISAAIYHDLINSGHTVHADMSYFESAPHVAKEGNPGDCSQWGWQLNCFGLKQDSFKVLNFKQSHNTLILNDGIDKLRFGLEALAKPEIQDLFKIGNDLLNSCANMVQKIYLCVHIRRGDYLNVASHIISDNEFLNIISKFRKIYKSVVVLSDSKLTESFKCAVLEMFDNAEFMDNIDEVKSHVIMRKASSLICSNSQFSLVAAVLNSEGLIIVPKQWFNGENRQLEAVINEKCRFQLFNN